MVRCTRLSAAIGLAVFVFGIATTSAYFFYESTCHTVLDLRVPPPSTMIGETVALLAPHFNRQLSHHPLYYAAFSRTDDPFAFLGEVEKFYHAFDAAVAKSFIGPHVTIIQSLWNVPSAGDKDVLGPDLRTTLIKVDNNLTAADQDDVMEWLRDFAHGYQSQHPNFTRVADVHLTGVGAMTAALRDSVWVDMIIVAAVAIVLSSVLAPLPVCLDSWLNRQRVATPASQVAVAGLIARGVVPTVRFEFSAKRTFVSTAVLCFFGTLSICFTALSTMRATVDITPTSSLAPILGFLLLCPMTCLFIATAIDTGVHAIVRRRTESEHLDVRQANAVDASGQRATASSGGNADNDDQDARQASTSALNVRTTRGVNVSSSDNTPRTPTSDPGVMLHDDGTYAIGFEGTSPSSFDEDRDMYDDARAALAPWLAICYMTGLLLCGALWLVHVEAVSSAGCGCFFVVVVQSPIFLAAYPYAMSVFFPSSALEEHAFVQPPPAASSSGSIASPLLSGSGAAAKLFVNDDAETLSESSRRCRVARWLLRVPVVQAPNDDRRSTARFALVMGLRVAVLLGLIAVASVAAVSAIGNVAFFREVPRNAPTVVYGHRLLDAIGAATSGPYNLVFKTRAKGGLLTDPNALVHANVATFTACRQLGFDTSEITSITHFSLLGASVNVTLETADLLLLLKNSIGAEYAYLWEISVDSTNTYFQTMLYANFDPYGQDRPVAVQEMLGPLVEQFRRDYSDTFDFVGWYGANAPTWAAMETAMPRVQRWNGVGLAVLLGFIGVAWLRWGNLDPSPRRVNEIRRGGRRDPLAAPSQASSCARLAVWQLVRSTTLGLGHALACVLPALLSCALGFAFAVWMFQYGAAFGWIWPILPHVEGISWLVVPILVPAAAIPAICIEVIEWFCLYNEHRRITAGAPSSTRRSGTGLQSGAATNADLDDAFDANLSPRSSLVARSVMVAWVVGFLTLGFSKTIMINEVGVVLAVSLLAQMCIVGPVLRPPLQLLLDVLRRRF